MGLVLRCRYRRDLRTRCSVFGMSECREKFEFRNLFSYIMTTLVRIVVFAFKVLGNFWGWMELL